MRWLSVLLGAVFCASAAAAGRPNVVLVVTDDQGYADLGALGLRKDIRTPNLDRLAREGVLFTDGYVTAPQCSPSRAAILTGRYQQRCGFDSIKEGPLPLEEKTIADRLRAAGYTTGMVGKWHLEPNVLTVAWALKQDPSLETERPDFVRMPRELQLPYGPGPRGFRDFYWGEAQDYLRTFDLEGKPRAPSGEPHRTATYRVDEQTAAALAFLRKQGRDPFFLYVAYYAPHVLLETTKEYLDRFPENMPARRRAGLAMIAAVDAGVGRMLDLLEEKGLRKNTLFIFLSDNGAPLGAHEGSAMTDILPVDKPGPAWDGSRNDPLNGEKGMLAEGGIRVPFILSWPERVAEGLVWRQPVSALDIASTINAAAKLPPDTGLDGIDLLSVLAAGEDRAPERDLFWRFWNQAAVRSGDWKLLKAGADYAMLFDLAADRGELRNVIAEHPDIAAKLEAKLSAWAEKMKPAGVPSGPLNAQEEQWYGFYFGKEKRNIH